MSRTPWKKAEDFDDERQKAFVFTAFALWGLVFLFMVLRDPVWRLLHEGELVSALRRPASSLPQSCMWQSENHPPSQDWLTLRFSLRNRAIMPCHFLNAALVS